MGWNGATWTLSQAEPGKPLVVEGDRQTLEDAVTALREELR